MPERINVGYQEFIKAKRKQPYDIAVIQKNSPALESLIEQAQTISHDFDVLTKMR